MFIIIILFCNIACVSDHNNKWLNKFVLYLESKSGDSSGAEGPSSVRSSEDGSEGSGAVGGGTSTYKERGEDNS